MNGTSNDLPPGFVIREPSGGGNDLPPGFVIRQPEAAPVAGPRASLAQAGRERIGATRQAAESFQDFVGTKLSEYGTALRGSTADLPSAGRGAQTLTQGTVAGIPGQFGDIETAGRAGLRAVGVNVPERSALPTTERIANYAYGRPRTREEESLRELGSFFSPLGGLSRILTRGVSETAGRLIPESSPAIEASARRLEREGIVLDPTQTARSEPLQSPGALGRRNRNQEQVNRAVTREAGLESATADSRWLADRSKALGDEYKRIYSQGVNLDPRAQTALQSIRDGMAAIVPAQAPDIIRTANNILDRFPSGGVGPAQIAGNELQALRNNISAIARRGGPEGVQAAQMVGVLDDIFINGLPAAERTATREALNLNNRRYGAFAELERLADRGYARGGNVDLLALGDQMASQHSGFSRGTARNPLAELALAGRETNLTGLTRGAEGRVPATAGAVSNILSALRTLPVRTEPARIMQQRRAAGKPAIAEFDLYGPASVATVPAAAIGRVEEERR